MSAAAIKKEFVKGLWTDIPPFRFVLGLCPTLGVTDTMFKGFGMGAATLAVLVCSNLIISLLRKVIPDEVRVASYIVVIASFVVCTEMVMEAFAYDLFQSLGIFIPLIVVNCLILGRAESFAKKNGPVLSVVDGLGMGIGFTLSLTALGAVREILGKGIIPFTDIQVLSEPFEFFQQAPGAFVALGLMLGIMNLLGKK